MRHPTKESFLKDVENHEMKILKDDGLYKHIKFKRPETRNMFFDIITFPEGLLIRGDMGTYEFERIEDMLSFFRHHRSELEINAGYWAEKVQAESVFGQGIRVFDVDGFKENVKEYFSEYFEGNLNCEEAVEVWDEIESKILCGEESEWFLVSAVNNWDNNYIDSDFEFVDFFESSCTIGTYNYIWCCYAIAWAVIKYDEVKS